VHLVRSYEFEESIPRGHAWGVMDASLATTAALLHFKRHSITMDRTRFEFEDAGAYGANNPTEHAWRECKRLGGARDSLFIGLGTGSNPSGSNPPIGLLEAFEALAEHGTDVHGVTQRMGETAADHGYNMYVHVAVPKCSLKPEF
jgi:hypothetical protein